MIFTDFFIYVTFVKYTVIAIYTYIKGTIVLKEKRKYVVINDL